MDGRKLRVWPGESHPRGTIWDGRGIASALLAENAEHVELYRFGESGGREVHEFARRDAGAATRGETKGG
jgi:hypothetical protein